MFGMHILIKDRYLLEGELNGGAEILHNLLDSGTPQYTGEQIKDELAAHGATLKAVDMGFIPTMIITILPIMVISVLNAWQDAEWGIEFITHLMDNTDIDEEEFTKAHKDASDRIAMKQSTARIRSIRPTRNCCTG